MQTSVWRDILDYSITGNKLGLGSMSPLYPFDKVYTKQLFVGTNAQAYPVITSISDSGANIGLSWYSGYGPVNYYGYNVGLIESTNPAAAPPFFRLNKRSEIYETMFEVTSDKPTHSGILNMWENSGTRKTVYINAVGTSYILNAILFGKSTPDGSANIAIWPFQVLKNAFFKGSFWLIGAMNITGGLVTSRELVSGMLIDGIYTQQNTTNLVDTLYNWYVALRGNIDFTSLIANEVTQITSINDNILDWTQLATIDQNLRSTGATPAFESVLLGASGGTRIVRYSERNNSFGFYVLNILGNGSIVGTVRMQFVILNDRIDMMFKRAEGYGFSLLGAPQSLQIDLSSIMPTSDIITEMLAAPGKWNDPTVEPKNETIVKVNYYDAAISGNLIVTDAVVRGDGYPNYDPFLNLLNYTAGNKGTSPDYKFPIGYFYEIHPFIYTHMFNVTSE